MDQRTAPRTHPRVEHRPDDFSMAVFRSMVFPDHLHTQIEIVLPTAGRLPCLVDGEEMTVGPGEALVVFPTLAAMRVCATFKRVTVVAACIGMGCALVGMLLSILLSTPVGSTIVLLDAAVFVVFLLVESWGGEAFDEGEAYGGSAGPCAGSGPCGVWRRF